MASDGSLVSKMELEGRQVGDSEHEWRNETLRSSWWTNWLVSRPAYRRNERLKKLLVARSLGRGSGDWRDWLAKKANAGENAEGGN